MAQLSGMDHHTRAKIKWHKASEYLGTVIPKVLRSDAVQLSDVVHLTHVQCMAQNR